jgi:hypothetical protein
LKNRRPAFACVRLLPVSEYFGNSHAGRTWQSQWHTEVIFTAMDGLPQRGIWTNPIRFAMIRDRLLATQHRESFQGRAPFGGLGDRAELGRSEAPVS